MGGAHRAVSPHPRLAVSSAVHGTFMQPYAATDNNIVRLIVVIIFLCAGQPAAIGPLDRTSALQFNYTEMPFSLTVQRGTDQLFAIKASRFIFKVQI